MKFKRVKLMGKNLDDVRQKILDRGMIITDENFDMVIAHGGDGTLLWSERDYPGVPKLPMRDARTAPQCKSHCYDRVLDALVNDQLEVTVLPKLEGLYGDKRMLALNDIFVHNLERASALRYQVLIDNELYANEIVGDSVGVATVHGSTAYYRSITHSLFRVGMGLAFSNSTEEINHLVISEKSEVAIRVFRGPALIIADMNLDIQYIYLPLRIIENLIFVLMRSVQKQITNGIEDNTGRNIVIYGLTDECKI
jgi:NAD+ kinase